MCLVLGPNEAQALYVSLQENSVRDTAIGKQQIGSDSERSKLHRVWAIAEGECGGHEMWCVWLVFASWMISYANEWEDHSNNWRTTYSSVFLQ